MEMNKIEILNDDEGYDTMMQGYDTMRQGYDEFCRKLKVHEISKDSVKHIVWNSNFIEVYYIPE